MISSSSQLECASSNNDLSLNFSQTNLFRALKTKSLKTGASGATGESGDQRTMDAADTLVSLAHSASSTPTVEFKPFRPADEFIEKTIKLDELSSEQNSSLVESACKLLIEQVLKSCPTVNLSSITIKASTKQSSTEGGEPEAKRSRAASDSESDSDSLRSRPAPTLATGRRSRDLELPPDEARKRQDRRERNKQAAARCRRRREELAETLSLKTSQLNKEQENLKRNYDTLLKEKTRWEKVLSDHLKECKGDQSDSGSVALTPTSAGLAQNENILNYLEAKSGNGLTRPNNLNLKSTTSATLNSMATPSSATLNSVLQGIALAFGQSTTPASFSLGSNNNISFVMTPTFNMNTPTAFLSLTPIESQLGTLNTPMLIQSNPLLAPHDSESKSATNNASKS